MDKLFKKALFVVVLLVVILMISHGNSLEKDQNSVDIDTPHVNKFKTAFDNPIAITEDDDNNFQAVMDAMKEYTSNTTDKLQCVVLTSLLISLVIGAIVGYKSSMLIGLVVAQLLFINIFFTFSFFFSFKDELERTSLKEISNCKLSQLNFFRECENQKEFSNLDFFKSGFVTKTGELISNRCFELMSDFIICDQKTKSSNYFDTIQRVIGKSMAEFSNSLLGNLNFTTIGLLLLFSNVLFCYAIVALFVCLKVGTPFIMDIIRATNEKNTQQIGEQRREMISSSSTSLNGRGQLNKIDNEDIIIEGQDDIATTKQ